MQFLHKTVLAAVLLASAAHGTSNAKHQTQAQLASTVRQLVSHVRELGIDIKTLGVKSAVWVGDTYKDFSAHELQELKDKLQTAVNKGRHAVIANIEKLKLEAKELGINVKTLGLKSSVFMKEAYKGLSHGELRETKDILQQAVDKAKAEKVGEKSN